MCQKLIDFILLYGSQTGQAQAIAENILERTENEGFKPRLHCLSGTEKQFKLEKETLAVFVLSTTGDGDYPDTASKFCRRLHKKDLPKDHLKNLSFALLGLGDTNYNNFCASPKKLEKRLLDLGAKKFYDSGFCDDGVGTELTAEPWMDNLVPALKKHLGMDDQTSTTNGAMVKASKSPDRDERSSVDRLVDNFVSNCSLETRCGILDDGTSTTCDCKWPKPSIRRGERLDGIADLKVPVVTAPFLDVEYAEDAEKTEATTIPYPSQGSPIFRSVLIDRRQLTKSGSKKNKFEISLELQAAQDLQYEPGDAFYFIVPNVANEVEWLLKRLKLDELADKKCKIRLLEDTTRKNAKVPPYLEHSASLRDAVTNRVDIRRFLSKAVIRYLADCCTNDEEKRRLLELVSTQGTSEYDEFVRNAHLSIVDVLHTFPSCQPSAQRLFEFLPQLQPRPFSIANYATPDADEKLRLKFVYSLISIPAGWGRFYAREGLATGWLTKCTVGDQIDIFLKKPGKFRLSPENAQCSLLMIGPGTGVAPFLAFLERIKLIREKDQSAFPDVRLLFGCRNENLDFIFRQELEHYLSTGILRQFHVAFSRDDESAPHRYVQDVMRQRGEEFAQLLLDDDRSPVQIFVCGDAKHMAVDVFNTFVEILVKHGGKSDKDATEFCRKMQEENRYVQDVWA